MEGDSEDGQDVQTARHRRDRARRVAPGSMAVAGTGRRGEDGLHDRVGEGLLQRGRRAGRRASPRRARWCERRRRRTACRTSAGQRRARRRSSSALDDASKGSTTRSQGADDASAHPDVADGADDLDTISTAVGSTAEVFSEAQGRRRQGAHRSEEVPDQDEDDRRQGRPRLLDGRGGRRRHRGARRQAASSTSALNAEPTVHRRQRRRERHRTGTRPRRCSARSLWNGGSSGSRTSTASRARCAASAA